MDQESAQEEAEGVRFTALVRPETLHRTEPKGFRGVI